MRAAVVNRFREPLVIEDRPMPEPGRGQVRVHIETSGVCHTDIHAARGDWPVKPTLPLVPGHEGVGLVDALGEGVTRVTIGQRVAIPWLGGADGTCEFCVKGLETYCVAPTFTGYTVDGGYREYSIANADFVGLVPEGIDPLEAAPLSCAGVTTYKAVKAARSAHPTWSASSASADSGTSVCSTRRSPGRSPWRSTWMTPSSIWRRSSERTTSSMPPVRTSLRRCRSWEARTQSCPRPPRRSRSRDAFASLRPAGRLVLVGLPEDNVFPLPIFETVLAGSQVIGSLVGTREDLNEVFQLHVGGRTRVVLERRELEQVNECFADVLAGTVPARLVFDLR